MITKKIRSRLFMFLLLTCGIASCDKLKDSEKLIEPYNPGLPVEVTSFSPEKGGMASQVIIRGSNFGDDVSMIKVWYNNKEAFIIGTSGDRLLVETPRQPGDTCAISVVIGNDSVVAPTQFIYETRTYVTTITGQKGTEEFKEGSLALATFHKPQRITIDGEGNMFGGHRDAGICWMLNEAGDLVSQLPNVMPKAGAPTIDETGQIVTFPDDGGDTYYIFDANAGWAGKRSTIIHPSTAEIREGAKDFTIDYKTSFATGPDGMIYTYSYTNGQLIKFDPRTRKGTLVSISGQTNTHGMLLFHPSPTKNHLLYVAFIQKNCIYTYDTDNDVWERYAGTSGVNGWRDGFRLDAQLGEIGQFVFDENYNLVFSDAGNHCIRQITEDGQVSTLIGTPKVAGYKDGNPDEALFNYPRGMCIDKDYTIYIADTHNNCIRKLSIE